jgi:hypothetical protein
MYNIASYTPLATKKDLYNKIELELEKNPDLGVVFTEPNATVSTVATVSNVDFNGVTVPVTAVPSAYVYTLATDGTLADVKLGNALVQVKGMTDSAVTLYDAASDGSFTKVAIDDYSISTVTQTSGDPIDMSQVDIHIFKLNANSTNRGYISQIWLYEDANGFPSSTRVDYDIINTVSYDGTINLNYTKTAGGMIEDGDHGVDAIKDDYADGTNDFIGFKNDWNDRILILRPASNFRSLYLAYFYPFAFDVRIEVVNRTDGTLINSWTTSGFNQYTGSSVGRTMQQHIDAGLHTFNTDEYDGTSFATSVDSTLFVMNFLAPTTTNNVLTINSGYAVSTSPFENVWVFAVVPPVVEVPTGPRPAEIRIYLNENAPGDGENNILWGIFLYNDANATDHDQNTVDETIRVPYEITYANPNTDSYGNNSTAHIKWDQLWTIGAPSTWYGPVDNQTDVVIKLSTTSDVRKIVMVHFRAKYTPGWRYEMWVDDVKVSESSSGPGVNELTAATIIRDAYNAGAYGAGIFDNIQFPAPEVSFTSSQLQTMATLFTQIPDQGLAHYTYSSTTDSNLTAKSFEGLTMTHAFSGIDGAAITPITADTQYTVVAVGEQDGEYVAGFANLVLGPPDTDALVNTPTVLLYDLYSGDTPTMLFDNIKSSATLGTDSLLFNNGLHSANNNIGSKGYVYLKLDTVVRLSKLRIWQVTGDSSGRAVGSVWVTMTETERTSADVTTMFSSATRLMDSISSPNTGYTTTTEDGVDVVEINVDSTANLTGSYMYIRFGSQDATKGLTEIAELEIYSYVDGPTTATTQSLTWTPSASNNDISKTAIDDYSITESNVLTINSGYAVSTSPFENVWVFAVTGNGGGGPPVLSDPALMELVSDLNVGTVADQYTNGIYGTYTRRIVLHNGDVVHTTKDKDLAAAQTTGTSGSVHGGNAFIPYNDASPSGTYFYVAVADSGIGYIALLYTFNSGPKTLAGVKIQNGANHNPSATSYVFAATEIEFYYLPQDNSEITSASDRTNLVQITKSPAGQTGGDAVYTEYNFDSIVTTKQIEIRIYNSSGSTYTNHKQIGSIDFFEIATSSVSPAFTSSQLQTMATLFTQIPDQGLAHYTYSSTTDPNLTAKSFEGLTMTHAFSSIDGAAITPLAADTQYTVVAVGEQGGEYVAGYASLTGGEAAPSWSDSYTHVIRGSFESVDLPDGTPIGTSGITIPASGTLATAQTFVTGGSVGEINTDTNGLRYVEIPADSHIALPQYASSQSEIYHTFYFVVKSNNANGSIRTIANGSSDTFNVDIEATTWWLYPIVYNPNPTHTLDHSNTKYLIIVFRINKSSNAIRALFTTSTESSEATSMNSSSWGTQFNIGWSSGRANNFKIYEFGVIDDYVSDTDFDAIVQSLKDKYYENLPYVADVPPSITTSTLTWTPSASNNDISKTAIDDYSISESNVLTINSGYAVSTSPFDNVWVFAVVPPVVEAPEEKLYYRFFINTMKSGSSAHYEKVEVISQTTSTRRFYVNGNSHTYNNDIVQSSSRQSFSYVNNSSIWGFVLGTAPSQGEWFILDLTDFKDETVVIEVTESFNNHGAATYEIQKWTGEGVPELWDTSFANSNKSYINDPLVSNSVAPGSSGTIQVIVPEPVTGWEKVAEQNTSITVTGYGGGSVKRDTSTTFTVSTNATTPETISFTTSQLQTMATCSPKSLTKVSPITLTPLQPTPT